MLKKLLKPNILQPILTAVLIGALALLIFKFGSGANKSDSTSQNTLQEVTKKVSFQDAADKFMNNSYQVYTQGSLIVKGGTSNVFSFNQNPTTTPVASPSPQAAAANSYDNLFFYLDKGEIFRIDYTTYGLDSTLMINDKNEIVAMDNRNKTYAVYPVPTQDNKQASLVYYSYESILKNLFPFKQLISDYQANKFVPTERDLNLYSCQWKNSLFTSGETVTVTIETDPATGVFKSFSAPHSFSTVPTNISFDFRSNNLTQKLKTPPSDYKQIALPTDTPTPTKK